MLGTLPMMLVMALPLLLVVFTSRSQAKKQKKLEESLKVGDRVVTRSGLLGKLVEVGDRTARLEIAPGVVASLLKTSIEGVDTSDKAQEKKA
jgi:preprotein translocase subunit YajC